MTESTAATLPDIERRLELKADPERVWRALTDPTELCAWFPDAVDIDVRAGAEGWMTWTEYGRFAVRFETVDRPRELSWRWAREPDTAIDDASTTLVEWRLAPRPDGGTTLELRESGFVAEDYRKENEEGWSEELAELSELLGGEVTSQAAGRG
jgi:uncharacterized protein YndB with AHSA1/START domain